MSEEIDLHEDPIGWTTGEAMDGITYNNRNNGILPDQHRKGLYSQFRNTFSIFIEDFGYERMTSQHKPDSADIRTTKIRAGFIISGIDLDERLGALVLLTKFLKPDLENAFRLTFGKSSFDAHSRSK